MKTLKIQIPNMFNNHCQMQVSNALKSIEGLRINTIEPGLASISIYNNVQVSDVLKPIENAGYTIQQVETNLIPDIEGETFKFRTNIENEDCISIIAPVLNSAKGIYQWVINTNCKDNVLTVHSIGISIQDVINIVKSEGFHIEFMNSSVGEKIYLIGI